MQNDTHIEELKNATFTPNRDKPQPLTIFAFGSDQTRDMKESNIMTEFSRACESSKLTLDGPDMLGRARFIDAAVNAAVDTIKSTINDAKPDKDGFIKINMVGYSRGATNVLRIANAIKNLATDPNQSKYIQEKLQKIKFNIILLDPVAGLRNKRDTDAATVPDNVENLDIIFSKHEMRRDFKPQDLGRLTFNNPKIKVHYTLLPGNHSGFIAAKSEKLKDNAVIAWNILSRFLTRHGTSISIPKFQASKKKTAEAQTKTVDHSPIELLNDYAQLKRNENLHKAYGARWKIFDSLPILPRKPRKLLKHINDYVKDADFFMNQDERELLKLIYPKTFNRFFEHGLGAEDTDNIKAQVIKELKDMYANNPLYFEQFMKKGYFKLVATQEMIVLGEPRGSYRIEDCRHARDNYPIEMTTHLEKPTEDADKLYTLETQLMQLIHQQLRSKDSNRFIEEAMIFLKTPHTDRLLNMREQLHQTLNANKLDKEKYQAILTMVEDNYSYLLTSGNKDPIVGALKELLQKHGYGHSPSQVNNRSFIDKWLIHPLGRLLQATSTLIRYVHNTLATICGFAFIIPEEIGRRGLRESSKYVFPLKLIGLIVHPIGWALRKGLGIPWLIKKVLVDPLQNLGNALVQNSGKYPQTLTLGNPENRSELSTKSDSLSSLDASLSSSSPSPSVDLSSDTPDNSIELDDGSSISESKNDSVETDTKQPLLFEVPQEEVTGGSYGRFYEAVGVTSGQEKEKPPKPNYPRNTAKEPLHSAKQVAEKEEITKISSESGKSIPSPTFSW